MSSNTGLDAMTPERLLSIGDDITAKAGRMHAAMFYAQADARMGRHAKGLAQGAQHATAEQWVTLTLSLLGLK